MPLDCDNIFEGDIDFTPEEYANITKLCPETIRELMRRDDWLLEVVKLLNARIIEQCERINDLEQGMEILEDVINDCCYTYYDILTDYVL